MSNEEGERNTKAREATQYKAGGRKTRLERRITIKEQEMNNKARQEQETQGISETAIKKRGD